MPRIFISFRKIDDRVARERVYQALVIRFGTDQVFKSGSSLPYGTDFAGVLLSQAARCEVMVVLIGQGWADAADDSGRRLLDREEDWVRREIATALRSGNRVLPVLLGDGTRLPAAEALPDDIRPLAGLQFLRIEESRPETGLGELTTALAALLPELDLDAPPSEEAETASPRQKPEPARIGSQRVEVTDGGVGLNVGGDLSGRGIRIIGGDDRSRRRTK